MQLLILNAVGEQIAPPRMLDPRRRRLSQVIGRHVDKRRPHMIAVQRARDPLQPIGEAWVVRGRDKAGKVRPWPRRYLPADAVVIVVYTPRGGAIGGGSRGGKSPLNIALGIAGLALVAFAGPLAAALLPSLVFGTTAATILQAGLVFGGTALLSLASRAKANKPATDTTQIYGVAGGGNLPKQGDRIPRGYGRSWMKPDLSQPDFSQYDGDDQILFKRHTLGVGRYRPYRVRAAKQVVWEEASGFVAPFDDSRNRLEFLYGTPSTLVPSNIVAATGVGGALPRPADNPAFAGPFVVNQRGALVTRLQVDFQFPQGISSSATKKSGAQISNQPGFWSVLFEYAPIDAEGHVTGPWQTLYDGSNVSEGTRFATHPLRYTKFLDVPAGRYAVRGRNRREDTTPNQGVEGKAVNIDVAQWDGASGWVGDVAVRPGITEVVLRLYATKGTQAASYGEIEVDAAAIIPVWTGSAWGEQETSKAVWAYLDVMRNADYGGAISDDQIDVGRALTYAGTLGEFDTFDATLRGPISVYEAAATVLLPMRAEPVHNGRFWSFVRDEPKAIRRRVVTRRQMLKGSSQIAFDLDTEAGAGHVIGEFDQDGDYRNPNQATAIYGAASLTPTRQRWTGVRTFAHAAHLTRWRAASGAYRRQTTPFGVEMEGRIYRRGDSIAVDPWFIDVRKAAGVVDSSGNTLTLDADVSVASGDVVQLRDRAGREWGPLPVTQGASPRAIVLDDAGRAQVEAATGISLAQALSDGRRDMTTVLVGSLETARENYLIQSVRMDGATRAQVEALIDDPRVWEAIGASAGPAPTSYAGLTDPESPALLGLTANVVPIAAGYRLDYTIRPGRGAASFEVGVSYDAGTRYDDHRDVAATGSLPLNPVDPTTLRVRARAFGRSGLPGVYVFATAALGAATVNAGLPLIGYADLDADNKNRLDTAQATANQAAQTAITGIAAANTRLDNIRRALAADPKVRAGYVDSMMGDVRQSIAVVTDVVLRMQADVATLRDNMASAGLEVLSDQGIARLSAVSRLETAVGERLTSVSVSVDALAAQVKLYGSVQAGDLTGLVTQITTVSQTLDALQGTVSTFATIAQFTGLSSRLGTAEQTLDAQGAAITQKASQTTVDALGTTLSTVQTNLSAATGRISQLATAASTGTVDGALMPGLLARLMDITGLRLDTVAAQVARAETAVAARIDDAGRSVAELSGQLLAFAGDAAAQFTTVTRAIASASEAQVQQQTYFGALFGQVSASLTGEINARVDAVSALTVRTDGALSRIGGVEAAQTVEEQTRASAVNALSSSLASLTATVNGNLASITTLSQAVADNQASTATQFSAVSARFGAVEGRAGALEGRAAQSEADIQSLFTSTANDRSANATAFESIGTRFGTNEASIASVQQAQSSATAAQASINTALYARSDAGTASGRFYMQAVSAPSGVSVRLAAQASIDSYGTRRNAGWYLDLMPDGTSRFIVDANYFAITGNGGITYPFFYDGQTLTIPTLRVTQSVILPGAASEPRSIVVQNVDAGSSSSDWREIPGTAVIVTPDATWSVLFSGAAVCSVHVVGSNATYYSGSIGIALGLNGQPYPNSQSAFATASAGAGGGAPTPVVADASSGLKYSNSQFEIFGSGSSSRLSLLYKFEAGPGSTGKIDYVQFKTLINKR